MNLQDSNKLVVSQESKDVAIDSVLHYKWPDIKPFFYPKHRVHYLFLDSSNRVGLESDGYANDIDNKLSWVINSGRPIWDVGYINVNVPIKNIIAIELGTIAFCDRSSVIGLGYESTANSVLPISNEDDWINNQRITVLIEELSSQAVIGYGNKYHFMAKRKEIPNNELATSYTPFIRGFPTFITYPFNKGRYEFHKPILQLDTLNIRLYGPEKPIIMNKEIYNTIDVLYDTGDMLDPTRFSIILVFGENVYFNYSDITVSGFTTADPVGDANVVNAVNTTFTYDNTKPKYYSRLTPIVRYKLNVSSVGITPLGTAPTVRVTCRYSFRTCLRVECLDD